MMCASNRRAALIEGVGGADLWNSASDCENHRVATRVACMASLHRLALACAFALALNGCGFEHAPDVVLDAPPVDEVVVSFGGGATMADETSGTVMLPVLLSRAAENTVTVAYSAAAGSTATRPGDYALADGTLTFAPGQTEQAIELAIEMDALEESEETIIVELAMPVGATLGATTSHTVTISSDILPRVSFADATPSSANEATSPQVELVLTIAPKQDVTVELGVTGTASGADCAVTDGQVITFAAGATSKLVPLGVVQDILDEDDETLVLALKNPSAKLLLAATNTARTHTIADDDAPPQVAFAQAAANVSETATAMNLTVQLSAVSGRAVTVPFTLGASSTAENGEDYTFGSTAALTIPAGMTTANVVVNVKADTLDEGNETVVVELGTPTNATLGAVTSQTVTINDDDSAPSVAFTSMGVSSNEATSSITLTVQLSDISGQAVSVPFSIDPASTATSPADYTISPASQVTIPAGQTSTTITIAMNEDMDAEGNETVSVELAAPTNATLGTPSTFTLTIIDDD